ncbi:OmpP1/FadL family transporter [Chitinimonas sp. BJYL2]|uniref:OmpP1/FadL family transporter n=1 Tax=Chitinimonas sp. BJYL2 TaxID=2976696 RepID=UPI0022B3E2C6|nr:OmpP1/FadL family transporter [Chitinimonas sp. BJYL2]
MNKHALRVTTLLVTAALAQYAHASGFQFSSQSAASQATANSSAAEAADASTISYNPAGLSYLDGTQFSGTLTVVVPTVEAKNATGRTLSGNAIAGRANDKIGDAAAAPHTYFSSRVNDRFAYGMGIYVPFGSGTEYEKDSVLRYNVNQTHLAVIALNPAVSFKLTPKLSVGFGVVAQHAEAELRQYANFAASLARVYQLQAAAAPAGSAQQAALGAAAMRAIAQDGKGPLDGFAEISGDDWGVGFNFGMLLDVSDNTRVGFNYRSKVKHELAGTADWTLPSPSATEYPSAVSIIESSLGYRDSAASVKVTTPESYSLHIMHKFSPVLRMYADISRTNHSSFTSADVKYAIPKTTINPAQAATFTRLNPNWKDTTKVAIGGSYQLSDPLQLRFGIAHDKSPVPSANDRLSTLPDSDRSWLSFGAKYAMSKSLVVDAAYSYISIKDASANVNGYCGGTSPATAPATAVNCVSSYTTGTVNFESSAHLVGIQASYRF